MVEQLLLRKQDIKIIVRCVEKLPDSWKKNTHLTIIKASVLDISREQMQEHIKDCDAVLSCLGHNLNLKGIFGKPRRLVTNAVNLICSAIGKSEPNSPVRFILMNTSGNSNRDVDEPISTAQKVVIALLRALIPPHADNEDAADYLRTQIGQDNSFIEWIAVRPDGLVNFDEVSEYELFPSPIRSAIFNAGKTSRINVAHFMAELSRDSELWKSWKGQMPVIYNKEAKKTS